MALAFLLSEKAAKGETSDDANPFAAFLLSDGQIQEKCRASVATRALFQNGKTRCEATYEQQRDFAREYESVQKAISEDLVRQNCGALSNQNACLQGSKGLPTRMGELKAQLKNILEKYEKESKELAGEKS